MDKSLSIECKPYEAFMSKEVCNARKKKAVEGDGLTNRRCLECPAGEEIKMEEKLSLKCKVCERTVEAHEKFFHKTQECKRCYEVRLYCSAASKEG